MGKKRILCTLLVILSVCLTAAIPVHADFLDLASEAAVLMDAETGQILYDKNGDERLYPASITKIMTAMLAMQNLAPEQLLTVSQSAVDAVPRTSSHISLMPGETLTAEQALYSIGMESANDAANVLAEAVSGDLAAFARLMTETAHSLGAVNTNFTNANGLPDSGHYTTAADMAKITAAALKVPGLDRYFSTVNYILPATNLSDMRSFSNKDRLLPGGQYYYDGVLMAKTGWTTSAQGTFAAAVRRGDTTLIAVTLRSPMLEDKYRDTWKLMNYGFSGFSRVTVTGEQVAETLELGEFLPVRNQVFSFLLPQGTDVQDLFFRLTTPLPEIERDAVTVSAVIEGAQLPAIRLDLRRTRISPQAAAIVDAVDEILTDTAQTIEESPPNWPILAAGAVILLCAARILRKQHLRQVRRRRLRSRIQRMKKQMR